MTEAPSDSCDELPAVTDMIAAQAPGSPLVHEHWTNNVFVEFTEGGDIEAAFRPVTVGFPVGARYAVEIGLQVDDGQVGFPERLDQ